MKVERDKFLTQLERLSPAIGTNAKVPAFLNVWFDGEQAAAYDGGLGIMVPMETEFSIGVPGKPLLGLMSGTSVEKVELTNGKGGLEVKIGSSKVSLAGLPPESTIWPFPTDVPAKTPSIELTEGLLDAMRRLLFVRVAKPVRVEHNGITLFPADGDFHLITTNSRTMAQITQEGKLPKNAEHVVLPRGFVEQMIGQIEPGAKLYLLSDCLIAEGESVRLCSNLLDSQAVTDLPGLITKYTKGAETRIQLPKGLGESLNRAALLSKGEDDAAITLSVEGSSLSLSGTYAMGKVTDTIDLGKGEPPEAEITVELEQLRAALGQADEFGILPKALVLYGGKDFICLIAGKVD